MQDSTSDWEFESAKMHDAYKNAYKNAYLTIAATSAVTAHDGFLNRQRVSPPLRIPYLWSSCCQDSFHHHVGTSVWNKRAWTLQEWVLTRRVLHFAEDTLYFECPQALYSERKHIASSGAMVAWPTPFGLPLTAPPVDQDNDEITPNNTAEHRQGYTVA